MHDVPMQTGQPNGVRSSDGMKSLSNRRWADREV